MSSLALTGAIVIALLAATCQSLTAFGFALVMVPLLSLAWEVKPAVVTSTLLGTVILLPLTLEVREHVRPARAARLLAGSLLGIPAGVVLLDRIDPEALKVLVGAVVIVASLLLYSARQGTWPEAGGSTPVAVGMIAGVLRASTSMGGPPAVLYLLGAEKGMQSFRATLLAFSLPASVVTIAGLTLAGQVTGEIVRASAIALPAVAVGLILGRWMRAWIDEEVFRTVVLAVLILTSVAVIVSASGRLM
ncbi:MAG: sulfite exporter TauE/SafE family protein [Dehalococcoidia bacterium]